jgi:anaerobic magnesium-protoporphyrin IX monomethyl ester cyclase
MKITLIHPPLDDPTLPYHSTSYLRGHLEHNGFRDVSTRDLNVEFVNYCLDDGVSGQFEDEIRSRLSAFAGAGALEFSEQEEFYSLWSSERTDPGELRKAVSTLRSREMFTGFSAYQDSIQTLRRHFRWLSGLCYPSEVWDFNFRSRGRYSIYHLNDLFDEELNRRICYPLERFFFDRCVGDADLESSRCIGISIVYDHQMLPALHLARLVKRQWPDKLVLLGGTAISQCYKYLKDKSMLKRFFGVCDGIVVGEGETAICEIANSDGNLSNGKPIPNLITYDSSTDSLRLPAVIHYEHVASLGAPVYAAPWDLYLSPERGINYSPTRGCYWNRCTFCDYGLNTDKPTSPWRERPVDKVIEDLARITREQGVRYVYFAVDVMAPGYLERLCDGIRESRLDIRWAAELRMEKIFSKERCRKLAESGCVAISFGMESGNQRVLDLIDKGTKVAYMGETMKNFSEQGIAVQLMAFTHFPTETDAERKETETFLEVNKENWSSGGLGKFVLTGTALVAKNPEKFNLTLIEPRNADIVRALAFEMNEQTELQMVSAEEGDSSFEEGGGLFPSVYGRPWAGGTDALHSLIYYDTYGRNFFKEHTLQPPAPRLQAASTEVARDSCITVHGTLAECNFDVARIVGGRTEHGNHIRKIQQGAIEPTYGDFMKWQQTIPRTDRSERPSYWILQDGKCLKIDRRVYSLLQQATVTNQGIGELLASCNVDIREALLRYLLKLESKGYVSLLGADDSSTPAMLPEINNLRNLG